MSSLTETEDALITHVPDKSVSVRDVFGIDSDMKVPAFSTRDAHVPDLNFPGGRVHRDIHR